MGANQHYTTAGIVTVAATMLLVGMMIGLVTYSTELDFDIGEVVGAAATITAGWLAWRAVQRQIESHRADAAEHQLDRFTMAIKAVLKAFDDVQRPDYIVGTPEQVKVAKAQVDHLRAVVDSPEVVSALHSSLFGPDTKMVAMFVNSAVHGGADRAYGRPELKNVNMVLPLYVQITKTIEQRKDHLFKGGRVDELRRLRLIDHAAVHNAYIKGKIPVFG
jgi:hypothetical protein